MSDRRRRRLRHDSSPKFRLRLPWDQWSQAAAYVLFRVAAFLARWTPWRLLWALGSLLGALSWAFAVPYRRLAARNLRIAFPHLGPDARARLCRRHFQRLGANLVCGLKMAASPQRHVFSRLTRIDGIEHTEEALRHGRGIVYLLAHLSNWEMLPHLPQVGPGVPRGTLFQPLGNRHLNAHVQRLRARDDFRLFDRHRGFLAPVRHLRENGVLGVLSDQHAGDGGVWVPLFGRLASTTNLPALLALRTGAPILPVALYTDGPARWRLQVFPPLDTTSVDPGLITAEANRALEAVIRQAPEDAFWVHNRWKTPRPNFLLSRYKRGVVLPPGTAPSDLQPFHILVRGPNWLGDACMALPAVRAIKLGRPDAVLTLLTPAKLASFWHMVPEVDFIIEKDVAGQRDNPLTVRRRLRKLGHRFDAAILLPDSPRSALEIAGCGIGRIAGYRGRWRSALLDQVIPPPPPAPFPHHVRHFLHLAEILGAEVSGIQPTLAPPAPVSPRPPGTPPRLAVCPGAEYGPAKRWPVDRFAEVVREVSARSAAQWIIVGTSADHDLADALMAAAPGRLTDLTGQTTLAQLAQELASCDLLLTNDTGTMHLAAALGVPLVAVFGSTEPRWTGPMGENHTVLRHHVPCSPCFKRQCPLATERYRCLEAVTAAEVTDAVLSRLGSLQPA